MTKTNLYTLLTRLPAKQLEEIIFLYGLDERFLQQNANNVDLAKNLLQYAEAQENNADFPKLTNIVKHVSAKQIRRQRFWWFGFALLALAIGLWTVFFRGPDVSLALREAEHLLDLAEYTKAEAAYDKILQQVPEHRLAQQGYLKAQTFKDIYARSLNSEFAAGQAQQRLAYILADQPGDPHVLKMLGDMHTRTGEYDQAARYYRDALARRDSLTSAHFGLGTVLLAKHEYIKARPHLEQAVADSPWDVKYLDNLGNVYLLQGEYALALEQFSKALQRDGDFLLLYQEIALAYWWQGDIAQAVQALERLTARLDDTALLQQEKNRDTWWFPSPRSGLSPKLETWADKRAYIFESLASGYFLLDDKFQSKVYFDKAWQEKSPIKKLARLLVKRDVDIALQAKPELAEVVQRWRALVGF